MPAIDIAFFNLAFVQMHLIYLEAAKEQILGDSCESRTELLSMLNLTWYVLLDQTEATAMQVGQVTFQHVDEGV